ncbi:glycosyltransferase family 2 protein [Gilvimarinus algae]|uniref:Glycosyltransferase family 2 protein n=1 Tax=Gilvimarinus algae TaxID=3058037 RepID=A0ABT8TH84_9GAMM|nr:glycosyltransferase family 2 protein [Gilvimarinus sp. SDUM040014]MDO3383462.1 glycosyltransferase family 2 protein [Gilvimarinus sp. SDUM040014]
MSDSVRVCAVIPVYNHAHLVGDTLRALRAQGIDCVLVNDGGDEQATQTLRALASETDSDLVEQFPNGGKGRAVLLGMHHGLGRGYTHALQIDADGQHEVSDARGLIQLAEQHSEAVITGIPRYDESVPRHRYYSRYLTHVWVWIETLSFEIKDSMCGFRVYPLAPVMQLARDVSLGGRMDFDTEVLVRLHWRGVRVVSVPTRVVYPANGVSNFRLWGDNVVISWMHTKLVLGMLIRLPVIIGRRLTRLRESRRGRE